MNVDPDEGEPSDEPELPEGVTEETIQQLVENVSSVAERIGLHSVGVAHLESHGEHLLIGFHFQVGQLAFTKDVQDPTQARYDDDFRKLSHGATQEEVEDIRNRYMKRPKDGN